VFSINGEISFTLFPLISRYDNLVSLERGLMSTIVLFCNESDVRLTRFDRGLILLMSLS
jgi:hypothetical protein